MTAINHGTVAIERIFAASATQVFAALSTQDALLEWSAPSEGWTFSYQRFDFRVGHTDIAHFGPIGGETYVNETSYLEIRPEERIVFLSTIAFQGRLTFTGIVTMELEATGSGTLLRLNETGAYLDDSDSPQGHEAGWADMLDGLAIYLKRNRQAA